MRRRGPPAIGAVALLLCYGALSAGGVLLTGVVDDDGDGYESASPQLPDETTWNNTVRMSVLLPGNSSYLFSLARVRPAVELAVSRSSHEFGWQFRVTYRDSGCQSPLATMHAVRDHARGAAHVFLGPACDYAAASVARLLKFWRLPMVTAGALAYDFWDKVHEGSEYYLMTRAGLSFSGLCQGFLGLSRRFGWRRMLILFESEARKESHGDDYCFLWAKAMAQLLRNSSDNFEFDGVKLDKRTPLKQQLVKAASTKWSRKPATSKHTEEYAGALNPELDRPFRQAELCAAPSKLTRNTSPVEDRVIHKHLRNVSQKAATTLLKYFNDCWEKGDLPAL